MPKTETTAPFKLELPELPENLESYTGEQVRISRLSVPLIRVNYKSQEDEGICPKGEFIEYDPLNKTIKAIGKKIIIQILHHRQSLSAFKQLGVARSESYYTPEISMKEKSASLFCATSDNGKRTNQYLITGEIKKDGPLRSQYPDLRYQRSLYIIHENQLKCLVVYGASFSGFIDLTKELKGQSSSSVLLELSTRKEKTGTVTFFPVVFTVKEKVDVKTIEPTLKELSDWFTRFDSLMAQQQKDRSNQASIERGDGPVEDSPVAPVATTPVQKPQPTQGSLMPQKTITERLKEEEEEEDKVDLSKIPF